MAIDRAGLRAQLDAAKANRGNGRISFLKKGTAPQRYRIVQFSAEGEPTAFARLYANWQKGQDNKSQILNRQLTLGATDAPTKLRELCNEVGETFPYDKLRQQYLINAINIDENPPLMRIVAFPVSAWEQMVELLLTDQWGDYILDPQQGHPLIVSRSGTGLDTEYFVNPDRAPWPIPPGLLKAVVDPLTVVIDPGVQRQCDLMNMTIEQLFGEASADIPDIEPIVLEAPKPAAPQRQAPARPTPTPARPVLTQRTIAPVPPPRPQVAASQSVPPQRTVAAPPARPQAPVRRPSPPAPPPQEQEYADEAGADGTEDQTDLPFDEAPIEEGQEQAAPVVDTSRLPNRPRAAAPAGARSPGPQAGGADVGALVRGIISGRK